MCCVRSPRECNINNLMVYALKDKLTEFSYTANIAGLFYSLKPTKSGFQLCAEGFSEKIYLLISSIVEAVYCCDFTESQIKNVLEVHRKALQSCTAEPLRNQSKYLLNALLSATVWTRDQRLAAMDNIHREEVVSFGRSFLDNHSVECLYYGSITKDQSQAITDRLVELRAEYLKERADQLGVKVETNPNLEEWFSNDPVQRIVKLESVIQDKKMEVEEREVDQELLLPLGTNSVMVHNEQHTMSMIGKISLTSRHSYNEY